MRVTFYGSRPYDRTAFAGSEEDGDELRFVDAHLGPDTVGLAAGSSAVCLFVNDRADASVIAGLAALGVTAIALRCAGSDNVDLLAAKASRVRVARVAAYSPHAVAEHAVALMLALNRKIHRAYNRVREGNFSLDGLLGFDMHGKTVAIIGTGRIGAALAGILAGFGCRVVAHDLAQDPALSASGVAYLPLEVALAGADIVSLHLPLSAGTRHLIDARAIGRLRPGCMLVNTGRGGLIDTAAAIAGLESGRIGALGLDVYEGESGLFFEDHSGSGITDRLLSRLLSFPNVIVTGHQAFFTREALAGIVATTMANLRAFRDGVDIGNDLWAGCAAAIPAAGAS